MQRADLTVYEQAQGFQMMLDLGETQEAIAEKTGFSKTTIRHRLKLLELDPEEFRRSQERQPTLSDYMELERISDPELKNKALSKIGTSDFAWAVSSAVRKEEISACRQEWLDFIGGVAKEVDESEGKKYSCLRICYANIKPTENDKEDIAALGKAQNLRYRLQDSSGNLFIYGDEIDKSAEDKARREREKADARRRERSSMIAELENRAAELRKEFVANFHDRSQIQTLTTAFLTEQNLDDIDYYDAANLLGIEYGEDTEFEDLLKCRDYEEAVKYHPESVMVALLSTIYEGYRSSLHNFSGEHIKNKQLEKWYALLTRIGYKMSSDEVKLLAGTHECFKGET
jgi:ParB family chromosome partitioning protein